MYTAVQWHRLVVVVVGGWGKWERVDSNNIYHNYDYSSFMSSSRRAACILTRMRLVCLGEFIPFHTAGGVRLRTTSLYLLMPHLSAELIWTRSLRGEDTHSLISCLCARADQ